MNRNNRLFTPEGEGYRCSASGTILLCAHAAYSDDDVTLTGRANAQALIDSVLSAAFAGGFKQGDIVRTMLADPRRHDSRLADMLEAACAAAGDAAIGAIFDKARIKTKL
ncbi:phosphoribosylformylglycinamidine (FGAM) synthase-like amidotransferase family enzyme [Janthinobacterium sp. CG_23.3]|uniref:hypothetical protein n=1 Tax=Janthinobacterium sp. CG_23.3 TaxID=3349634 RepID=UPI0038D502B2